VPGLEGEAAHLEPLEPGGEVHALVERVVEDVPRGCHRGDRAERGGQPEQAPPPAGGRRRVGRVLAALVAGGQNSPMNPISGSMV
jgi:hypothetical protein